MSSAHESVPALTDAPPALRRVALVGNPNVGKTTVFNLLTGRRQKVANYPGVTVERKSGRLIGAEQVEVVDLPGTYSLNPRSLDERIAYDMLAGRIAGEAPPDLTVCVVDATNLERNLYLVSQVIDLGLPAVVALNMMDSARERDLAIDADALSAALGLPVVPMAAIRKEGLAALRRAIFDAPAPAPARRWSLMPVVAAQVGPLCEALARHVPDLPEAHRFSEVLHALAHDEALARWATRAPAFHAAATAAREALAARRAPYLQAEMTGRYDWLGPIVAQATSRRKAASGRTWSDRIDAVLTHRIFGLPIFLAVLTVVFQAVFSWAIPAMDLIEAAVAGLGALARSTLPAGVLTDLLVEGAITGVGNVLVFLPQILLLFFFIGLMEDTGYMARTAFIMDRLMSRVGLSGGSVVPLLSSFACAIPGIMAARTLDNERDRIITIMVAPLMSCSARLPVYTLFIAAFIPADKLFGVFGYQGLTMFAMYLVGTLTAFAAAWILKRYVFKGSASFFAMELPPYRRPKARYLFWRMMERSKVFAYRAGKIIFALSIALWFLASYPDTPPGPDLLARRTAVETQRQDAYDRVAAQEGDAIAAVLARPSVAEAMRFLSSDPEAALALNALRNLHPEQVAIAETLRRADEEYEAGLAALADAEASYRIRHSFIGRFGRALEPVMQPLGFDWKITAGIIAAFAAREVIVSTLATLYSVGDADEASPALRDQLKADRYPDGSPVFTPLVALSLLVFFVFALQCMSTLAIARRETNTWRWPVVMWLYMTGLGYLCSLLVYQGGLMLGLS